MLKTLTLASISAAAMMALSSPALAQEWDQAPYAGSVSGTLTLSQSIILNCDVSGNVAISSATGPATINNPAFSPGGWQCGFLVNPIQPWQVDLVPGRTDVVDVTAGATSILGSCGGTARVAWDNATSSITFNNTAFPPTSGSGGTCTVNGTLTVSPPLGIDP